MKITLKVLLVAAILLLVYMCYRSIMGPIEFDRERTVRETAIQARLIDIRKAQIEFKNTYGVHAANFEELSKFLNEKKLPFVLKEGVLTDEQLSKGMTEKEAVKKGIIRRDTFWVLAKDTLFSRGFNADSLAIVPVQGVDARFSMDTATIKSSSGYVVRVFESGVKYDVYLGDLDHQQLVNLKDKMNKMKKFDGLRVGSVTEINNNAGNWEN
ncbi:MAG: hypothetical protein LBN71_03655 [Tannerella sp.]|jgi:hypothetical protein|nr:hypothetical protein [Tannerella sp.]